MRVARDRVCCKARTTAILASIARNRASGVICDQRVMLNGYYSAKNYHELLRRIRFKNPVSGKTLACLTNSTSVPAHHNGAPPSFNMSR